MMHILQMLSSHLLRGAHFFAHCTTPRRGEALNQFFTQNVSSTSLLIVACNSRVYFQYIFSFTVFSLGMEMLVVGLLAQLFDHHVFSCSAFSKHSLQVKYLGKVHTCGLHGPHDEPQREQAHCVYSETGRGTRGTPKHSVHPHQPSSHTSSSTLIPGLLRKDQGQKLFDQSVLFLHMVPISVSSVEDSLTILANKLEATVFLFYMLVDMILLVPCIVALPTLPQSQARLVHGLVHLGGDQGQRCWSGRCQICQPFSN